MDFLLLGGDLFHDNNPSLKCLYETVNLLGKYVLGDGEINFEMPNYEANFHDCNLNIELPIFIIHGNHDFPSHEHGDLSVIDLLHTSKYLNHFGKFSNLETIHVNYDYLNLIYLISYKCFKFVDKYALRFIGKTNYF